MKELYTKIENGILRLRSEKTNKYASLISIKFPNNFGKGHIMHSEALVVYLEPDLLPIDFSFIYDVGKQISNEIENLIINTDKKYSDFFITTYEKKYLVLSNFNTQAEDTKYKTFKNFLNDICENGNFTLENIEVIEVFYNGTNDTMMLDEGHYPPPHS